MSSVPSVYSVDLSSRAMTISLHNRQRTIRLDLAWLRRFADIALGECLAHSADERFALKALPEVEVAIVSDRLISRVHLDFMGIAGATDVITFEHGEIVMSAQTAAIYAQRFGHAVERELALYVIHGLLHLNGFDDRTARDHTRMHRVQERVMQACLSQLPPLNSPPP